jgi:hypothetical protein
MESAVVGLYDQIQCKAPLPVKRGIFGAKTAAEWKKHSFQTKDLDCALFEYEIRRTGLWKHQEGKWIKDDFTGEIHFYDCIQEAKHDLDLWIEFGAGFKDGKLDGEVKQIEWFYENNIKRKKQEQKWKEERAIRLKFELSKRYRLLYKHINSTSRFFFKCVFKALDWSNEIARKIESLCRI